MSAKVIVQYLDDSKRRELGYISNEEAAKLAIDSKWYNKVAEFDAAVEGEEAAEEAFDILNNPCREQLRNKLIGRNRSMSTMDIATVNGVHYLCLPMGWTIIQFPV